MRATVVVSEVPGVDGVCVTDGVGDSHVPPPSVRRGRRALFWPVARKGEWFTLHQCFTLFVQRKGIGNFHTTLHIIPEVFLRRPNLHVHVHVRILNSALYYRTNVEQ